MTNEVHLRHLTVDEALIKLDEFLHDAYLAGFSVVRIVHGRRGNTLRQMTQRELSRHPLVSSHRLGENGEGGVGVTIAYLSSR